MTRTHGQIAIGSREGVKVVRFAEHPRGDGSLRMTDFDEPMNARELRAAATELEVREKRLAHERSRRMGDVHDAT